MTVRPRGTCSYCGDEWTVRLDGTIAVHGPHPFGPGQWNCPGSGEPPIEGVLMRCVWCDGLFLSEDNNHRFCSERCVARWEAEDGSWESWDIEAWIAERTERAG